MVGNAVEKENLVQTKPKNFLHGRLLFAAIGGPLDEPVQQSPPADTTGDQFAGETGIGGGQLGFAKSFSQQPLGCGLLPLRTK